MKNNKLLIAVLISAVSVFSFAFYSYAGTVETDYDGRKYNCVEPETNQDGTASPENLWWDSMTNHSFARRGDLNSDGHVTAEDARLCLRYAARLVGFFEYEHSVYIGDVDENSVLTAGDARLILRCAARLDPPFNMTGEVLPAVTYHLVGLQSADDGSYKWIAACDKADGFTLEETRWNNKNVDISGDFREHLQMFSFKADEAGEYTVKFEYISRDGKTVADEFYVTYILKEEKNTWISG